jgi:hypothetical protein
MARFVLVHGAFAGAWIWGPLVDQLMPSGITTTLCVLRRRERWASIEARK